MKKLIVIGASSGIGERIARDFAAMGWRVGVAARREEPLRRIKQDFPDRVAYSMIDVTDERATDQFYDLIEMIDGMDILVYAAGVGKVNPQLDDDVDQQTVAVNCAGFTRIADAAYRYYRDTANVEQGQIAVISSIAGTKGIGIAASYSSSKRYQWTYIDALDQLAHQEHVNVAFTDIRPGFIDTPLLSGNNDFPMTMQLDYATRLIEKAIMQRRRVAYIDGRWRTIGWLWRRIPRWAWSHIGLTVKQKQPTNTK